MDLRILDHPGAFIDFGFAGFKLRFDQRDNATTSAGERQGGGENFAQGNKRAINGHHIGPLKTLWEIGASEMAGIGFIHYMHAMILAQMPRKLASADIHRENLFRAVLQEAIREAPGGGAQVDGDSAFDFNGERLEKGLW